VIQTGLQKVIFGKGTKLTVNAGKHQVL